MRVYRWAWLLVCAILAAVGIAVLLIVSPAVLVFLFLAFVVVGVVVMLAGAGDPAATRASRTRRVLTGAVVLGTSAPACVGFTVVLGAGVLLLMLIVAASSPYALSAYARWMRSTSTSSASTSSAAQLAAWAPGFVAPLPGWAPPQLGPDLDLLSTEELCQAWCSSYLVLSERFLRRDTRATLATVEERQRYLDEFERRNSTGLTAWLASGARVASNPLPYLAKSYAERPVINWDDLT